MLAMTTTTAAAATPIILSKSVSERNVGVSSFVYMPILKTGDFHTFYHLNTEYTIYIEESHPCRHK